MVENLYISPSCGVTSPVQPVVILIAFVTEIVWHVNLSRSPSIEKWKILSIEISVIFFESF